MQHLEYEHSRRLDWLTPVWLLIPPTAALLIALFVNLYWVNEPFMALSVVDLTVFFGGPLAVLALTATWVRLARRSRLRWFVLLPTICWFGLNLYFAVYRLPVYFREGWNY